MGVAKPITLETRHFAKKGDAMVFFKDMLARYRNGERVGPEDERHLLALIKHHTDYSGKVGVGIDHFKVDENTLYVPTSRCFWIIRIDGSIDDISYKHCITHTVL
jgi:hypothetical protein